MAGPDPGQRTDPNFGPVTPLDLCQRGSGSRPSPGEPALRARFLSRPTLDDEVLVTRACARAGNRGYQQPLPGRRVWVPHLGAVLVYGEPIEIPLDADRQGMETKRLTLQEALDRLTLEAETLAREDRRETAPRPRARGGR